METYWNGQPIQHMSTSHLINSMAWLWRMMMHVKFNIMPTKYGQDILGNTNPKSVEEMGDAFVDSFDVDEALTKINAMNRELVRRKRAAR